MGCVDTITYDKFPIQADENYKYPHLGKRVEVCYHYDTNKKHLGIIVRDDREEPFETIIKLDNGRYLRATECQFSYLNKESTDDVCEWKYSSQTGNWDSDRHKKVIKDAIACDWKVCPYCAKKIKVV